MKELKMKKQNGEVSNKKELFAIVTPITIQYLMMSLVSASDAFMLGFLDQDSLSAGSLATQVAFVYSLFFGAFVFGLNVLAAQYWGKKDEKTVSTDAVAANSIASIIRTIIHCDWCSFRTCYSFADSDHTECNFVNTCR